MADDDYLRRFEDEVVFLTGATGSLGGCLLYKLALRLPTKKIYALCRGSVSDAVRKWESSMPQQIDDILDTGKVELITGDLSKPGLGLNPAVREKLRSEVTTVINTAANISLVEELEKSVRDNCQTATALFEMIADFPHVRLFIHFSSLAVNGFLPGGSIEERIYSPPDSPDANKEALGLPGADSSKLQKDDRYLWPYGQAKHLAERLLLRQSSSIPVLIIRPAAIGPAISEPFALYGPDKAIPMHTLLLCFSLTDLSRVGNTDRPFEEVPVDLVASSCLLHLAARTTGVVHCASQLYVRRTAAELMATARQCLSALEITELFRKPRPSTAIMWQSKYHLDNMDDAPEFHVTCERSEYQKQVTGPLALVPANHDPHAHMERRIRRMYRAMLDGNQE
ncbi:Fatty acyl-CoA reductase [Aspergillus mulundensis]|uniref:Fatty acyl-CoA reductase n=1 Tax=Aspergillus mulundensis TaxID=1810919 RepID=A0A3D8RSD7_9EURO|nr:Fatty acyl-CoA reductase [Aspergillus mulundensis]RDW76878.1 Fatty acyl-CoA reductase [Aspergillus mulundensis]